MKTSSGDLFYPASRIQYLASFLIRTAYCTSPPLFTFTCHFGRSRFSEMSPETGTPAPQKKSFRTILLWALLITCLYLPTLGTPFDFIDDGDLVYPSHRPTLEGKAEYYWERVVANYEHLGPFRPTLWAHWRVAAETFDANPVLWRAGRLGFTFFATVTMLLLFTELGFAWPVALLTVTLAMWNQYRSEIWTSLTLAEGVAMPYAILTLVCALRGARSARPLAWDLAGIFCMLVALGCKNTFAVMVPVQILFRLAPDGHDIVQKLRKNCLRAALLSASLLLPILHYIYFTTHWHPGQYKTGGHAAGQFWGMVMAEKGAVSADFMAVGYLLALVAIVMGGRFRACAAEVWEKHRAPLLGGLALLVLGVGIYSRIDGIAGRYSMPAAWGLDMWIGILLTLLLAAPKTLVKQAAWAAIFIGLVAVGVSNIGHQFTFAARAKLLWQVVHQFENNPPQGAVAWVGDKKLGTEEGIHVAWHLRERQHPIDMHLFDNAGAPQERVELNPKNESDQLAMTSTGRTVPLPGQWKEVRTFDQTYWFGFKHYTCTLWEKTAD